MLPLVAAAAVAAVALGSLGAVNLLADNGRTASPATQPPARSSAPPATNSPAPSTSAHSTSSRPGNPVHLGQALIALPTGWVAHPAAEYLSQPQVGSWWCLTPAGSRITPGSEDDCRLNLAELPSSMFAAGDETLDVDDEGGFYGNGPQRCIPNHEVGQRERDADRALGGRAADWRRWTSHCSKTNRPIRIEQYVVASGPAYILYSAQADATVHAAMTEIARSSTLPAQTTAVRYMDRGDIRAFTPDGDGGEIVIDRVVRDSENADASSATYTYRLSARAWRSAQRRHLLKVGQEVTLFTDGDEVHLIEQDL